MQTMKKQNNLHKPRHVRILGPENVRILGYERDKAALMQAARSMTASEFEQRLIELASKWNI